MGLMKFIAGMKFLSEGRRLELYPPFFFMRVKVLEIGDGWRTVRMRLPLNTISRNPGGVVFGGFQASLADPIAALACVRIFPGYTVWTRGLDIDFHRGGNTDLELRFKMKPEQEAAIRRELEDRGRATPVFEYAYHTADGTPCTFVRCAVAIRPKGYRKFAHKTADLEDLL